MTEAQEVQKTPRVDTASPEGPAHPRVFRTVEMDGRSWTVVDLEDGMSWDVYPGTTPGGDRTPRIAHITVTDRGYFSTDVPGVIRGPYTTLDEAVYPIALGKRVLLEDPAELTGVAPPVDPARARPAPRARASRRKALILGALALGVLVLVLRSRRGGDTDRIAVVPLRSAWTAPPSARGVAVVPAPARTTAPGGRTPRPR